MSSGNDKPASQDEQQGGGLKKVFWSKTEADEIKKKNAAILSKEAAIRINTKKRLDAHRESKSISSEFREIWDD